MPTAIDFTCVLNYVNGRGMHLICIWRSSPPDKSLFYSRQRQVRGKTTAALHIIRHQLLNRHASRVLIVVPTSHLKNQWAQAALKEEIQLDSSRATALTADYHGAVITYQQLGRGERGLRELASRSVVVLDEVPPRWRRTLLG